MNDNFEESKYDFDNSVNRVNSDWNEHIIEKYKDSFLYNILKILYRDGNNLTGINFENYKEVNLSQLKEIVEYLRNKYSGSNQELWRKRQSSSKKSNKEYKVDYEKHSKDMFSNKPITSEMIKITDGNIKVRTIEISY